MSTGYVIAAGVTAHGPFSADVTPERAGWEFSALRVLDLAPDGQETVHTGAAETLVLPLSGSCRVACDGEELSLDGRSSVFDGPTDFAYLPRGADAVIRSATGGRFALPAARCTQRLAFRYGSVDGVGLELRGAGECSRQVHNVCTSETFDAAKLIVCEVITPSGNWSSYPPHKHDEERPGEAVLEEIYYFQVASGPGGPSNAGHGYHRVYGPGIDVLTEVRDGDTVLVPHGWHGPSMAAPGYDLYYLNVMAGPSPDRRWLITDDPDHAWIRDTWPDRAIDPRLPMTETRP